MWAEQGYARLAKRLPPSNRLHLEHHIVKDRFQVVYYPRLTVGACVLQRLNQPRQGSSTIQRARSQFQYSPLP
jgi:hypothetical protein